MLAPTPTLHREPTSAEVQIKVLADHLRRIGRAQPNPIKAAALAAAAATLQAAQERLTADLAQINAYVAPAEVVDLSPVTVGQLHLDRRTRQVTIADVPVRLTRMQYSLLLLLITEPSRIFLRAELHAIRDELATGYGTADRPDYRDSDQQPRRRPSGPLAARRGITPAPLARQNAGGTPRAC